MLDLLAGFALAEAVWRIAPAGHARGPGARGRRFSGWSPGRRDDGPTSLRVTGSPPTTRNCSRREALEDEEEDARIAGLGAILSDRRKLATFVGIIALAIVAIYVLIPKIVGFDDVAEKIHEADWYWVVVAVGFNILAFGAYVMLFRGILGGREIGDVRRRLDYRASYQITMAGLAATRIFSAAGAGGIILSYWALRKAGLERRRAACRMVAFLVLMYSVYLLALVLFGVLLRTGRAARGGADRRDHGAGRARGRRARGPAARLAHPRQLRAPAVALHGGTANVEARAEAGDRARDAGDGRAHGARLRAPPARRRRSRSPARSGSGRPTSGSCGRASRRSGPTCPSASSCRASSSA